MALPLTQVLYCCITITILCIPIYNNTQKVSLPSTCTHNHGLHMRISKNHNSLGCEQPLGLDVNQSPDAQGTCIQSEAVHFFFENDYLGCVVVCCVAFSCLRVRVVMYPYKNTHYHAYICTLISTCANTHLTCTNGHSTTDTMQLTLPSFYPSTPAVTPRPS